MITEEYVLLPRWAIEYAIPFCMAMCFMQVVLFVIDWLNRK